MNIIAALKVVFLVASTLPTAIDALEEAFPEGGKGQEKLEMLKTWIQGVLNQAEKLEIAFEKIWPLLTPFITMYVNSKKPK